METAPAVLKARFIRPNLNIVRENILADRKNHLAIQSIQSDIERSILPTLLQLERHEDENVKTGGINGNDGVRKRFLPERNIPRSAQGLQVYCTQPMKRSTWLLSSS